MSMTNEKIREVQIYMQLHDKGLVSNKTVLKKVSIVWEDEKKEIEKDIEFDKKRYAQPANEIGGAV